MKQLENKLFQLFAKLRYLFVSGSEQQEIETNVKGIVSKHFDTLVKLEKYDTGELEKPAEVARHTTVQSYLRSLPRTTSTSS